MAAFLENAVVLAVPAIPLTGTAIISWMKMDCTWNVLMAVDLCDKVRELACWNFQPRPNCFERMDEQKAFMDSRHEGISVLLGGNGAGTTTCALAKAVDFMTFQQPAPRKDCPFWIISGSYKQTMATCWAEKLHGKGLLDPNTVDWERISWMKPNMGWPFVVPLKPKPGHPGKNWALTFKSYDQGRASMQAESIGGFLFVEQFEWQLLLETMRGAREYNFVGNKLIEMTPVDPSLSIELREMMENDSVPPSWGIYHANTELAVEYGHVSKSWYRDFYGMLSPEMVLVRTRGLFSNFEGAVYPEWNTNIHCINVPEDEEWEIPPAWHHRRAIDFGFSLEHPFVCLWFCFDNSGRFIIYDEYFSRDTSLSVIDHWKEIADRHHWPDKQSPYYGTTWCDWDKDAILTLQKVDQYTDGEYTPPAIQMAHKDVHAGIEHVKYLLKPTIQVEPGKFEPRLKVVKKNCPNLCREMITYRYHKKLVTGVNSQAPRDEPVKDKDDCCDAMRYGLYSEATQKGFTPTAMAHQHSSGSTQIASEKFQKPRRGRASIPGSQR